MKKIKIPELLSPAGNWESLRAAVNNGCDAVYMGGKSFNARSFAENFSDEDIESAIDYCHARGVKVYITVNTLYKDDEFSEVFKFIKSTYRAGADAFIVQDIGVASLMREKFGSVKLAASTQMTASTIFDVKYLQDMGFKRVVLSRELSLDEIRNITENCDVEIEIFAHGALCVSYSGQCLMSSMLGGRSGNRGKCAGPCRLLYDLYKGNDFLENGYLLSPKDLMTLDFLPEITDLGISSLKIEGRMKSPEYVALVTKLYRQGLDEVKEGRFSVKEQDIKELTQIFNRGGSFTSGYFKNYAGSTMMSTKTPKSTGNLIGEVEKYNYSTQKCSILLKDGVVAGDGVEIWTSTQPNVGGGINVNANAGETIAVKIEIGVDDEINEGDKVYRSFDKALANKLKKLYSKDTRKLEVKGTVIAEIDKNLKLKLSYKDIEVEVTGDVVQTALNNPLSEEELIRRLKKTGNTPFTVCFTENRVSEGIYIDIADINKLRRTGIDELHSKIVASYKRNSVNSVKLSGDDLHKPSKEMLLSVLVTDKEQFAASLQKGVHRIYVEATEHMFENFDMYVKNAKDKQIQIFIVMPKMSRNHNFIEKIYDLVENTDCDGYLIRTLGQIYFLEQSDKLKAIDHTLNIFNSYSNYIMSKFDTVTLSQELNLKEISTIVNRKTEVIIHGKIPLMMTHQCPLGIYGDSKKSGKYCKNYGNTEPYFLKDRKNINFPILADCQNCVAFILNSKTLFMLNKIEDIRRSLTPKFVRLSFTDEDPVYVFRTINSYLKAINTGELDGNSLELIDEYTDLGITNGHFYRGIL